MRRLFVLGAALAATIASPGVQAQSRPHWVRAWTASMWDAGPANTVKIENATIRAAVRVGAAGPSLRLRLSNELGTAPVRIAAASVRAADGRIVRVTFGGQADAEIGAGAPLVSDAVALPVKAFEVVEVSVYIRDAAALNTGHIHGGDPTRISAPGDHSRATDFPTASTTRFRPLIAGIDVASAKVRPVVVAYGDSITDNTGCANDAVPICRWGDVLGRRLAAAGKPHVVVTQAISGNRVLTPGSGPSALARLDRDVLAVPGVSHLVLLEGINDIGNSERVRDGVTAPAITADQLIAGFKQLATRAHEKGIKVIAFTILPYEGAAYQTPKGEAMRVAVNNWIRTGGAFDAVVDMEKVVADPANPKRLAAALQGGDNLHPNGAGETKMGEAVPLGLFK